MNLMMLLEMAASAAGEREAVRSGAESVSYARLFAAAGGAASVLGAHGATHVALLDESSLALPVALFGSSSAGLPFAPLNYRLTGAELDALLERLAPVVLITGDERRAELEGRDGVEVLSRSAFLEAALARADTAAPSWDMDPDRIAVLLFTSGTTGPPKAAVLRQRHLVSYILGAVEFAGAGPDETTLVSVPPYHVAGIAAILSSVYGGRRVVQLPAFEAEAWLALARAEAVTHAFVVPTMLARIVDALGDASGEAPALRALAYGGGKMPLSVIGRALEQFPSTEFTNAYGLTETSSTLTLLGPAEHREAASSADPGARRRLASVGRPLPQVEIEIRDEAGQALGPGARGEICVRGEQVSGEYLGVGSNVGADGFLATRDAGFLDEAGYLFLEGRIDDVIVRGGENLSPGEIEDALLDHDAVADVAVVGVPDTQWGEAVAAAIVLHPSRGADPDELRDWVRARLRSSRVPQHVAFVDELPYNETGKLLRRRVREELAASD
ncbi:MAG: class I adenylate-forming enzyme family protein [Myxococcota bacterium]|nr:class I adenylate-forming enzyme family protein [Myxococcota bacterium]